jgi:outer membrane biosynthesis protein TonB
MTQKELRQNVLAYLTTKQVEFDASQRTAYLLKLAVKNGFETPADLPEKTPEEIQAELKPIETEEIPEETPEETPEVKVIKKPVTKPRPNNLETKPAEIEKDDNSVYWLLALAALAIAVLYFLKHRNNGTPEENKA